MQPRQPWQSPAPRELQLPLPLPDPPGIKTMRRADVCRYCHSVHMNVADFIACREANT